MTGERRDCIRAVVLRALADHPWGGLRRVAVSIGPAPPIEGLPPDGGLALRLDYWPEPGAPTIDHDDLDTHVLSPILDECLDVGRRVHTVDIVGWGAGEEGIPLGSGALYFVRRGATWDVA